MSNLSSIGCAGATMSGCSNQSGCGLVECTAYNFFVQTCQAVNAGNVVATPNANATTFPILNVTSTNDNPSPAMIVNGGMNASYLCVGTNISATGPDLTVVGNHTAGSITVSGPVTIYGNTGTVIPAVGSDQTSFGNATVLMQSGTATFTGVSMVITFPTPYATIPYVFATPTVKYTGDPNNTTTIPISNITTVNFTICINSTCTGTLPSPAPTFSWTAIGTF